MIDGLVAKRYAKALFELANEKNILEEVEKDLKFIVEITKNTEGFVAFLQHPQISADKKKELINSTFGESILALSKNFLYQLIENRRFEFIAEILREFTVWSNQVKGIVDITAITAVSLEEADKEKLAALFNRKLSKQIRLNNFVDTKIIGGLIIKIGDRIYDGSINTQLQSMKKNLTLSRV